MPPGADDLLGEFARARGLLTQDQLDQARREQARRAAAGQPHVPLGRILVEQGVLTETGVAEVLRLQDEGDRTRAGPIAAAADAPTLAPGAGSGAADAAPAPAPGRRFGPYQLVRELGRGGMGVVYEAWRSDLRATFALKVLLAGEHATPDAVTRFHREAQAAARLRHPGIVPVLDTGVTEGKPFFAMEFVPGVSLAAAAADPACAGLPPPAGARRLGLAVADAVRIVQEIADAVEHAHRQGVIHRDLKPGNILLARDGRPRVADFGLAKLVAGAAGPAGTRVTRTGAVLGTLAYMAPEQAEGRTDAVDARSDVYSLGVLLYELVTGCRPFGADSEAELLMKVLTQDPPRPRAANPELPPDLETILLKAMAKEPARRYPGAAAFAADLARYRAGQAVTARRPSATYRIERWVGRRRGLALALAVCALAGAVALGAAWRTRHLEAEQAALRARLLADVRRRAAAYVDATLALRRSGVPIAKARAEYLPALQHAVAEADRAGGGGAEAHCHLGRLYRALMQNDRALAEQDEVLRRDPGFLPARYERALLAGIALGQRKEHLRAEALAAAGERAARAGALAAGGGAGPVPVALPPAEELVRADPAASRLLALVQADLACLADAPATRDLTPAARASARAMALAQTSSRPEDHRAARDLFTRALADDPTLVEAFEGLAALSVAGGDPAAAIAIYTRALEVDAGYAIFWLGRGRLRMEQGGAGGAPAAEVDRLFAGAAADYARAIELDPESEGAWLGRAGVRTNWANAYVDRGQDPAALWSTAEADFGQALKLSPDTAETWAGRAALRLNWGLYQGAHGGDPEPVYAGADADFTRALELGPGVAQAWIQRSILRRDWGAACADRGREAEGKFAAAERDAGQALRLDPTSATAWTNRGALHAQWGAVRVKSGGDAAKPYADAEADFTRAIELKPAELDAWRFRGNLRLNWATWREARGLDPEALFAAAGEDLGRVIELAPAWSPGWSGRGLLRSARARRREGRGEDPGPLYAAADADFARAVELNPAAAEAWGQRGCLRLNWALWEVGTGRDAEPHYATAAADFGRALELNPAWVEGWTYRATLRMNQANARSAAGRDPVPLYREGLADFERARALNPGWWETWAKRGALLVNWGLWRAGRGEDPAEQYTAALADLEQAVTLNGQVAEVWEHRGLLRGQWAAWEARQGRDPERRFAEAVADLGRALELNPASAMCWARRGEARANWGLWRQARGQDPQALFAAAAEDYDRTIALRPADAGRRRELAVVLVSWAVWLQQAGADSVPVLRRTAPVLDGVLNANPSDLEARRWRGQVRGRLGQFSAAVADLEEVVRRDPACPPEVRRDLELARGQAGLGTGTAAGTAPAAAGPETRLQEATLLLQAGDAAVSGGRYAEARGPYEKGLQAAEAALAELPAALRTQVLALAPAGTLRPALMGAHYNLACILALASAGRTGPGATGLPAQPPAAAEAAALRDSAFAHLRRALELGWSDRAHLEQDSDLEALRADARWQELLGSIRR